MDGRKVALTFLFKRDDRMGKVKRKGAEGKAKRPKNGRRRSPPRTLEAGQ
jgi:hypothetical protein